MGCWAQAGGYTPVAPALQCVRLMASDCGYDVHAEMAYDAYWILLPLVCSSVVYDVCVGVLTSDGT